MAFEPKVEATIEPQKDRVGKQGASRAVPSHPVLQLQRQAGNQAIGKLTSGRGIQAKRGPGSSPKQFRGLPASGGQPLEVAARAPLETYFQTDLSAVRVHTGAEASNSAVGLNALAYTSGRDIYFASGKFAPSTHEGQRLLAHEVTHVIQQSLRKEPAAAADSASGLKVGAANDSLETEAENAAEKFVPGARPGQSEPPRAAPHQAGSVQRFIQRDDAKPATLNDALRTGDSDELDPFRPFTGITSNQLLSLVNLIVTEKFVSFREESILEEAWQSYGLVQSPSTLSASDFALWKSCAKRGADVKNVLWLRELRSQFGTEVRDLARTNLEKNSETINKEAQRLGITFGAAPGANPSPEADAAIKQQQKEATAIKAAKDALNKLRLIEVGYTGPPVKQGSDKSQYGGTNPPGGLTDSLARPRATFDPDRPPSFPKEPGDGMPAYNTIAATYRDLAASVAKTLNRNPALYALTALDANKPLSPGGADALAAPAQSTAEARAMIARALKEVVGNIKATRAAIDDQSLGFESMTPVQEKLYATHKVYSQPFAHAAARDYVEDRAGDAAAGNTVVSVATMALILAVEIGTAGAATPLIGALIGLTASAAAAADSWNQWSKLDTASRSTVSDAGSVVLPEQAEEALQAALISTIFALVDVYGAGKAARGAVSLAKVAGLEARLAATSELANLAARTVPEQKALLERVIEQEGALAAVGKSGRSADELIAIVGKDSAAGRRLAAVVGGVLPAAVDDVLKAIPQIGQKSAAEATKIVNESIDLIGTPRTLQRAGGWSAIATAVAQDKGVLGRLEGWRSNLVNQAEHALTAVDGAEGANAARAFLAERTGFSLDAVETALGILVMFLDTVSDDPNAHVSSSAEGSFGRQAIDLEVAATDTATRHNVSPPPVQLQRAFGSASPVLPLTESQLDALSPAQFEEVIRGAIGAGHFSADGLPRMSVLEMKINESGHGLDGLGFRRRADLVDVYKFEFKQVTRGSPHVPELGSTSMGVQGGYGWSKGNVQKLIASDDPVALETLDTLRKNLRRYFGSRYSESLLLEAFEHELARAPLAIITRAHAPLDKLIPQLRGLARSLGKGFVKIIPVRGRL